MEKIEKPPSDQLDEFGRERRKLIKALGASAVVTLGIAQLESLLKLVNLSKKLHKGEGGVQLEPPREEIVGDISELERAITPMVNGVNDVLQIVSQEESLGLLPVVKQDDLWMIHQARWYQNRQYAESDIVNPDDFFRWLQNQDIKYPVTGLSPEIIYDSSDLTQTTLGGYADKFLDLIILKNRYRLSFVVLSTRNATNKSISSIVEWEITPQIMSRKITKDDSRRLIHEFIHAFSPNWTIYRKSLELETGEKFIFAADRFTIYSNFYKMWLDTIQKNYAFFKKRFFEAKGDSTLQMIKENGGFGLYKAAGEWIAMLCTDLLYPPESYKEAEDPKDWPLDVRNAALSTLEFVRNGDSRWSPNVPTLSEDELALLKDKIEKLEGEFSNKL